MAIRTRDEILDMVRTRIGDATDDDALAFIEDVTDTLNDYETRVSRQGVYTEEEYRALDDSWRQRYRDRFFNSTDVHEEDIYNQHEEQTDEDTEKVKFEDLFKEGE